MKSNHYPNVVCQLPPGPPPTDASRRLWYGRCGAIVADMDATAATQVFGPRSSPGIAVGLPTSFSDSKCTILASTVVFVRL